MAPQRDWYTTDYYKTLGVSDKATDKDLRRAYRKLAKEYHPDSHPGSEERFKEISAAYDVLGDPEKRKEYDELRRLGPLSGLGGFGGPAGGGDGGGAFNFRIDDLSDIFGGLFGKAGRQSGRNAPGSGPRRGHDLEAELHLSFQDAVDGVVTTVNVSSGTRCSTCSGSGSRPGTAPVVCPRCGGLGVLNDNQGMFSLSSPCPDCQGRGTRVVDPCPACKGTGLERRQRQVKVRIPAGVEDGQRIRVKGRGEAGANRGPAGDLFVTVHVAPHPLFGRKGRNLTIRVPVTYPEATLGGAITVPSLDGPVTLKIPPGTKQGRTFRVKGRGVASGSTAGDLLVTVDVVVPDHLNDEQRKAVEALAKTLDGSPRQHLGV
ncbi:MAG: molecular chaperone DnaJ [Acidimicrobiales bacterium]|jgi:molecular chaperone DnaJ